MMCALALTPDARNDGFLLARDLFELRVPARRAVLSACDTGRGRVFAGEGMLGLARAFMLAGTPRVIASLWRVDDQATRALMVKFYELWHPRDGSKGLGAAAALRRAQEFVRNHPDHPKWKHPHYWAAWVLWGLPE